MTIIGLGYRAKSGKDTVGKYLVDTYGFHRVAFADVLKDVCSSLTGLDAHEPAFKDSTAILGKTGGQLLQDVGVALRNMDKDILIEASRLDVVCSIYPRVVVTDVRHQNEADRIKKLGGSLLEVYRNGTVKDTHVSESEGALITWDDRLLNTGTLPELYAQVEFFLDYINLLR